LGEWSPGIGDPSFMGWLTVVAYFVAGAICLRAARRSRRAAGASPADLRVSHVWWLFALALFALGVNKQLDLQTALTEIGKTLALQQGWYESRRKVQLAFIVLLGVLALGGVSWLAWHLRHSLRRMRAALVGGAILVWFVVARGTSFHHIEELIDIRLLGLRMNWVVELTGIAVIAFAAHRDRPSRRRRPKRG
jgi:hypothetical protein